MEQAGNSFVRLEPPEKCQALLEKLCELGDARLSGLTSGVEPLPVLLLEVTADERLVFDLSQQPELAVRLEKGACAPSLTGRVDGTLLRSAPLLGWQRLATPGRTRFACDWPEWLEVFHRRASFRAELSDSMLVPVTLQTEPDSPPLGGRLLNLSLGGCLIELPATGASALQIEQPLERLELRFPNGQRLDLRAQIRHRQVSANWQAVRVGCAFAAVTAQQERRLWFYVREIERERARSRPGSNPGLTPSPLFIRPGMVQGQGAPRQHGQDYATPMARRLARVALYLNGQLLQLQQGSDIDPVQLSRHSELILNLLDEDRESLLFAVHCLLDDPPLVQHCIAVAVRLADLARARNLPSELVKGICACALVHDLGKVLLPPSLLRSTSLDGEQRKAFVRHVPLLRERLGRCRWLPEPLIQNVVDSINERLDGSGYPLGLKGAQLGELARMAAVVDVIDAMGRARPDRPERPASSVYRQLIGQGAQLDKYWCQHFVRHFGLVPIGALVRFASGALGWVERLDRQGHIAQVRLTDQARLRGATLSEPINGSELAALGRVEGIVAREAEGG